MGATHHGSFLRGRQTAREAAVEAEQQAARYAARKSPEAKRQIGSTVDWWTENGLPDPSVLLQKCLNRLEERVAISLQEDGMCSIGKSHQPLARGIGQQRKDRRRHVRR